MRIDVEILRGLLHDEEYLIKTIPHIKTEYFHTIPEREIYKLIKDYHSQYKQAPSIESLFVLLEDSQLEEKVYNECIDLFLDIKDQPEKKQTDWLYDRTEEWAQDMSLHNAMTQAVEIFDRKKDDKSSNLQKTAIPELFKEALAVEFKTDLGMGYFRDMQEQLEYYQHSDDEEFKLKFDIEILNRITNGGIPRNTLNLCFAGVNCFDGDEEIEVYLNDEQIQLLHDLGVDIL